MDQPLAELSVMDRLSQQWWRRAAALLLVLLDLVWVVAWHQTIAAINAAPPDWKVWAVLGGVMALAYGLSLTADRLRLLQTARMALLGVLLGVSLLAATAMLTIGPITTIGSEDILNVNVGFLGTVGFTLWAWQRGAALGRETMRPQLAWRRFQFGLAVLILHTFATNLWGMRSLGLPGLTAYLFLGLLAVTVSRITYVSLTRSAQKSPFDRRWIAGAGGTLAAAVLLAEWISALLTGQWQVVLDGVRTILGYLTVLILFLYGLPGVLLVYVLTPVIGKMRELLGPALEALDIDLAIGESDLVLPEGAENYRFPVGVQTACLWIALAMVVAVVFLLVRYYMKKQAIAIVEGPESLLSEGDAARLARQALQDFFDGVAQRLRPHERSAAAQRIRQIYAALLELSAARDHKRPPGATPLEFLPALEDAFPGGEDDLNAITQAYLRVRYGEYPEDMGEAQALEAAWQRLNARGNSRRKI